MSSINKFTFVSLSLVLAVVFIFSDCSRKSSESKRIQVGAILFETGEAKSYGIKSKRGYDLALKWAKSRDLSLIPDILYADSGADESKGVAEFKRLTEVERIRFIVGITGSGVAMAICPLLREKDVLVLEALDSAAKLTDCAPNFFRIYPSDVIQGSFLADWALELGWKRAGLVYIHNAWGEGMQEGVENGFTSKGGQILVKEGIQQNLTDFSSIIVKVRAAELDGLFLLIYPTGARRWLEQSTARGLVITTLGGDALTGTEVAQAGEASNGLMFSAPHPGEGREYEQFVEQYMKEFGENPDVYATKSYDAMRLALVALNELQSDKPQAIKRFLLAMDTFEGAAGPIRFDENGDLVEARYARYIYENGEAILVQQNTEE